MWENGKKEKEHKLKQCSILLVSTLKGYSLTYAR